VAALQSVIARHDILRTAIVWEGVPEPLQVVLRHVVLPIEEVVLDPMDGDVAEQLYIRVDPRRHRLDVRQAPMLDVTIAYDPMHDRWIMAERRHHLIEDNASLRLAEIEAHLLGQADRLPVPLPFRKFVEEARLGLSRAEHERFFHRLLGDVQEPTAPFGLLFTARRDHVGIKDARMALDPDLARRIRACARALGVSPASVWHVAWALLLGRASDRDDVVFGTVMFGRSRGAADAQGAMGLFINTLPEVPNR